MGNQSVAKVGVMGRLAQGKMLRCDYTKTPPFAEAEWAGVNQDPDDPMCEWCAGTGHPYGDERYGICKCPGLGGGDEVEW